MVWRLFQKEPEREKTEIERWMKKATIDECLTRAKNGMNSQDVAERNGVPTLLRHVQDTIADRKEPKRIEASALYLLINARSSAEYCRKEVEDFLQENEAALGDDSVITIELYRALAVCCYMTSISNGGGKSKAVKNAKVALKRVEKVYGKDHPAYLNTGRLLNTVSWPVNKQSRADYMWVLL